MKARPKFAYFRSEKHLRNVAALPCQSCGAHGSQAAKVCDERALKLQEHESSNPQNQNGTQLQQSAYYFNRGAISAAKRDARAIRRLKDTP